MERRLPLISARFARRAGPCLGLWLLAAAGAARLAAQPLFVDVSAAAGLDWHYQAGAGPTKWSILESTGGGACLFDADGDLDLDLYLVNGGRLPDLTNPEASADPPTPASPAPPPAADGFFLNDGSGHFTEATAAAGLTENAWGGGCAVADIDNDGDDDLYVSNFGGDVLYRNRGDGKFEAITREAGLAAEAAERAGQGADPGAKAADAASWSLGATFFDADRDGALDLYVAHYLVYDPHDPALRARRCRWKGGEVMCGPRGFIGQADRFFRNLGQGRFVDGAAAAGLGGDALYGMGVVAGDIDHDGDTDLFVANDSQENLLWVNDGAGHFVDEALAAGVALAGDGRAQAGMGAMLGDVDQDGDEDLLVTNFSDDYHTLYRNEGDRLFTDITAAAGLDLPTRPSVGWGGGFFDADSDGDLDLLITSGHVYHDVETFDPTTRYLQRQLFFENDGRGFFRDAGPAASVAFQVPMAGRGAAIGDLDNDGDLDVVWVNQDARPTVLRNESPAPSALAVSLVGRRSARDGVGARLELRRGERRLFREARRTSGYLSSHDPRVFFGTQTSRGNSSPDQPMTLTITWPAGTRQVLEGLSPDEWITVDEEAGVVARRPWQRSAPTLASAAASPAATDPAATDPAATNPCPSDLAAHQVLAPVDQPRGKPQKPFTADEVAAFYRRAQAATQEILAGRPEVGVAAFRALLAELPPLAAGDSPAVDWGFGGEAKYRTFLAAVYDNLGVGALRAELFETCDQTIRFAIQLEPQRSKRHQNLGLCLFRARRFGDAIQAFQAAALPGAATDLPYDLGRALAAAGRCAEAETALREALAVLPSPDPEGRDADAWYVLGSCQAEKGQFAEAARSFRQTLAKVPGHQKALYKLAFVWDRAGSGDAAAARQLFRARQAADEALQLLKRGATRKAEERLDLLRAHLSLGQGPQAVLEARIALTNQPQDPVLWGLYGEALLSLNPPLLDLADQAFTRALGLDPNHSPALLGRQVVQARRALAAGHHTQALELARPLANRYPRDPLVATLFAAASLAAQPDAATAQLALDTLALTGWSDHETDTLRLQALERLDQKAAAAKLRATSPFLP